MSGIKHDQDKPQLDLIPSEALEEIGKVLTFGAKKYSPGNWANGIEYRRLISACQRHVLAFNAGEDLDAESGLSHISHALCCLVFLAWHIRNRPDLDNRWVKDVKKKTKSSLP